MNIVEGPAKRPMPGDRGHTTWELRCDSRDDTRDLPRTVRALPHDQKRVLKLWVVRGDGTALFTFVDKKNEAFMNSVIFEPAQRGMWQKGEGCRRAEDRRSLIACAKANGGDGEDYSVQGRGGGGARAGVKRTVDQATAVAEASVLKSRSVRQKTEAGSSSSPLSPSKCLVATPNTRTAGADVCSTQAAQAAQPVTQSEMLQHLERTHEQDWVDEAGALEPAEAHERQVEAELHCLEDDTYRLVHAPEGHSPYPTYSATKYVDRPVETAASEATLKARQKALDDGLSLDKADAAGKAAGDAIIAVHEEAIAARKVASHAGSKALNDGLSPEAVDAAGESAGAATIAGERPEMAAAAGDATGKAVQKALDDGLSPEAADTAGKAAFDAIITGKDSEMAAAVGEAAGKTAQKALGGGLSHHAADAAGPHQAVYQAMASGLLGRAYFCRTKTLCEQQEGYCELLLESLHDELQKCRKSFGDRHLTTLASMDTLGQCAYDVGDLDCAESLLREMSEGCREVLGDMHPDTLGSINNLGRLLQTKGDLDGAKTLYREAVEGFREVLGEQHPDTLTSTGNYADLLCDKGDFDGAWRVLGDAPRVARVVVGVHHVITLRLTVTAVRIGLAR